MQQPMIEVLMSGQVIAIVPKGNEDYYRDVFFRGHPDERKVSYRPHKTPEEKAQQQQRVFEKINISEMKQRAMEQAAQERKSIMNIPDNPVTNVTVQKSVTPTKKKSNNNKTTTK